jgi:hypothetical protein
MTFVAGDRAVTTDSGANHITLIDRENHHLFGRWPTK